MRSSLCLAIVSVALASAEALYSAGGPVVVLDQSNFKTKLKDGIWMVEFYAPWCGHCKSLKPEWDKAAKALAGIVNVGAVDADSEKSLGGEYKVQGFPTIKLMYSLDGKIKSQDYSGGRTAKDIVNFAMDKAKALALKRIGAKPEAKPSGGGGSAGGGGSKGAGAAGSEFYPASSKVVNLHDGNFDEVLSSDDSWFIEFYAPWCGHCKNLKGPYTEAAKSLDGKVKLGAVNCDEEKAVCGKYGIKGFPTIKFFGRNKDRPESYEGARDAASIVQFGTEAWSKNAPAPEVRELTDNNIFVDECVGDGEGSPAKQLCFVAFLPDILDSKASGRKAYIAILKTMAESYKDRPYSYFWSQGGAQPKLEANVGVGGYGYPALAAISPKRGVFVPLKSGFSSKHVREYVEDIRRGALSGTPLFGTLAEAASIDAWDGKDGKLIEEDEFDLDDLMKEEL